MKERGAFICKSFIFTRKIKLEKPRAQRYNKKSVRKKRAFIHDGTHAVPDSVLYDRKENLFL